MYVSRPWISVFLYKIGIDIKKREYFDMVTRTEGKVQLLDRVSKREENMSHVNMSDVTPTPTL